MPQLKQLARQIFHETLAAIDIPATMQRKLRRKGTLLVCGETRIDLRDFERLRVVAIGKAAHAMVDGLALVLAPFVRLEGVVSAPTAARKPLTGMKYFVAGHPVPNAESWKARWFSFCFREADRLSWSCRWTQRRRSKTYKICTGRW